MVRGRGPKIEEREEHKAAIDLLLTFPKKVRPGRDSAEVTRSRDSAEVTRSRRGTPCGTKVGGS